MSVLAGYMSPERMPPVATTLEPPIDSQKSTAASPQRTSINDGLKSSTNILRRSSRRLFKRPLLEKTASQDGHGQASKETPATTDLSNIEIIYKDDTSETQSEQESQELSQSVALQTGDETTLLRPCSTESGERTSSTISDESISPLSPPCTQLVGNFFGSGLSTASSPSCTERVACVLREMIETERTYVKSLQEIIQGYVTHMRKHTSVSEQRTKELFMNIEEIHTFNREFLAELEGCINDPVEVANKFVLKGKGFEETYTQYCTQYPKAVEVLTEFTRNRETACFLQKIQAKLGHSLPLGSYMLKPVQRILKYHLLWQDIKKHYAKEDDPDGYDLICDALLAMTSVACYINEMKRKHEATLQVQEIQSQLSYFEGPDLTTYGDLVLEDTFRMSGTKTERYLILFEKIILITKRRDNGFMCKATLMLSNMMLAESISKEPLSFQIIRFDNQKITYTFLAKNMEQKRKWTLEIKRLILETLTAQVPTKAKDLILGKGNRSASDADETEPNRRKRAKSEGWGMSPSQLQAKGFSGHTEMRKEETNNEARKNSETEKDDEENTPCDYKEKDVILPDASKPEHEEKQGDEPIRNENDEEETSDRTGPESFGEQVTGLDNGQDEAEANPQHTGSDDAQAQVSESGHTSAKAERKPKTEGKPETEGKSKTEPKLEETSGSLSRKARRSFSANSMYDWPSSVTESQAHKRPRHYTAFGGADIAKELGKLGLAHARKDFLPHSTQDARAPERASSSSDLRYLKNDSITAFSRPLEGITGNSAIKTTVRNVSRAFSETGSASPERKLSAPALDSSEEAQERILDDTTCATSEGAPQHSLDDIFASIERDIDETRRTINSAQLLESALRIKNDSKKTETSADLSGPSTDLLNMRLRATERMKKHRERLFESCGGKSDFVRPKEFVLEPAEASAELPDLLKSSVDRPAPARENDTFQQLLETANKRSSELHQIHTHTIERMKKRKEQLRGRRQVSKSKSEVFIQLTGARTPKIIDFSLSEEKSVSTSDDKSVSVTESVSASDGKSVTITESVSASDGKPVSVTASDDKSVSMNESVSASYGKSVSVTESVSASEEKSVFTESRAEQPLKPRTRIINFFENGDDATASSSQNAAREDRWPITPQKWELPNVHSIARQFSRIIHDQEQVSEIRKRADKNVTSADSLERDPSPPLHVERVTKVTLESGSSGTKAETRLVRRRRKHLRYKFGEDNRRSSWACDHVETKTEGTAGNKARPKSVFVRQPPLKKVEVLTSEDAQELGNIDEGLEPMKEKDDVVMRGLVQNLVNLFERP